MPKTKSNHRNANKCATMKRVSKKMKGGDGFGWFASKKEYEVDDEGDKQSSSGSVAIGAILLIAGVVVGSVILAKKH